MSKLVVLLLTCTLLLADVAAYAEVFGMEQNCAKPGVSCASLPQPRENPADLPAVSMEGDCRSADGDAASYAQSNPGDAGPTIAAAPSTVEEDPTVSAPELRGLPDAVSAELSEATNSALRKEMELMRLNTNFRVETTDKGRAKPWRVFAYNLAGSAVATAGITTIAAERWRTWQRPATAKMDTLKAGPMLLLISHSIIAAGLLVEAGIDAVKDRKLRKRGFDPKTMKKRAIDLRDEIDRHLLKREQLVASLPAPEREVAAAEGLVLKDIRNMAINEYVQTHVRSARRKAARDITYLNGFSAATTGGYLGSLMGLLAVANRKPRLTGPGGIGFTISGANIAAGPWLARAAAHVAGKSARKKLVRDMGPTEPAHLDEHVSGLKTCPGDESLANRLAIYSEVDSIFKRQAEFNAAEKKKSDKEFLERALFNAAIGGTKMAWGIQLANAGFSFRQSPPQRVATVPARIGGRTVRLPVARPTHSRASIFAHRVAQGSTTYIPGTSLWILDTLQARTRSERDLYTMGSQNALPLQKLKERLATLEKLDARLKGSSD